jgi:hypothetical protein
MHITNPESPPNFNSDVKEIINMISGARLIFGIHTPSELTPNAVGLKRAETSSDCICVHHQPIRQLNVHFKWSRKLGKISEFSFCLRSDTPVIIIED